LEGGNLIPEIPGGNKEGVILRITEKGAEPVPLTEGSVSIQRINKIFGTYGRL